MKIVVLERDSVTKGDIDYSALNAVADVTYYGGIPEGNIATVIGDSDGVIVNKTTGKSFNTTTFPAFIQTIIENGGLIESIKNGAIK